MDNMFIRWVHGVRRLSSMQTLRESAIAADVLLKRNLYNDFMKSNATGRLGEYHAPAMLRLPLQLRVHVNLLTRTRPLSLRRVRSVTLVKTSSAVALKNVHGTQGTHATPPDIGSDHGEEVVEEPAPQGSVSSLSFQEMPVAVEVPTESHAELVKKVEDLRETFGQSRNALGKAQSRPETLECNRFRLQMMKSHQNRVEANLHLLIRMQHPVASPMYAVQATLSQHGTGHGMA
uniref:Uncharacterized protein n=1 Tax=Peronospora matthiolae TaxID=2874970 RepID=A0AAV1TWU0_9STRA